MGILIPGQRHQLHHLTFAFDQRRMRRQRIGKGEAPALIKSYINCSPSKVVDKIHSKDSALAPSGPRS